MNEHDRQNEKSVPNFAQLLETHARHQEQSATDLIAEVLDICEDGKEAHSILPAFVHGLLCGLKLGGQ